MGRPFRLNRSHRATTGAWSGSVPLLGRNEQNRTFRYLFSGDVGRGDDDILRDPQPVENVDYLQIEATYGARVHAVVPPGDLDACLEALRFFTELSQVIRLCVDGPFDPKDAPAGLLERVCRAGDCPDIGTLEGEVKRLSKAVREVFGRTVIPGAVR